MGIYFKKLEEEYKIKIKEGRKNKLKLRVDVSIIEKSIIKYLIK